MKGYEIASIISEKTNKPVRCLAEVGRAARAARELVGGNVEAGYRSYDPFAGPTPPYQIFAALDPSNENEIIAFANRHGLLEFDDVKARPDEPLARWGESIKAVRRALALWRIGAAPATAENDRDEAWRVLNGMLVTALDGGLTVFPEVDPRTNRPCLVALPRGLKSCVWYSLYRDVAGGWDPRECERCARPFAVPGGDERRGKQVYCSGACQVAAFRAKKRAEASTAEKGVSRG